MKAWGQTLKCAKNIYALELKSFSNISAYYDSLVQANQYAVSLNLKEITLVFFVC